MSREAHWEAGLPPLNERKAKPMRNFLTARWRRYAVAFVVAAASVGIIAACTPTKPPPPPSNPCNGGPGACLTIQPDSWTNASPGETKTFTVTNTGPDETQTLDTNLGSQTPGSNYVSVFSVDRNASTCPIGGGSELGPGGSCTIVVKVSQTPPGGQVGGTDVVIAHSANAQPDDPAVGGNGVHADVAVA
jgi:hypothetical protein